MEICKANIPYTLLVATREIKPGDKLAADCYGRDGQKVATEGEEVDQKLIDRMRNMRVRKAWLERSIPEWMPLPEAELRSYEIVESHDVSPLHFQILSNFQGTFSTQGLQQIIDRIQEAGQEKTGELTEDIDSLARDVQTISERESRLREQIEEIENEELKERYYNLLASASPQAVDPSEIEGGQAGTGRKIQGFLENLNELKSGISNLILDMDEDEITDLFNLEELDDYESTPDFADAFVLFERFFSLPDLDDDPVVTQLFELSQDLLKKMFYRRELDEEKLQKINNILWNNFSHGYGHWYMTLGLPGELESYLLTHSVNTAIMVSQLYRTVDRKPETNTEEITLACLVKDIGMVLVPQSYHLHDRDLTQEQQQKLNIHPLTSKQFLRDVSPSHEEAVVLVEGHHEQINGAGYPLGKQSLNADQKLLNICDQFDAMTSPRTWRPAIPPCQAMKYIRQDGGDSLDQYWVHSLIRAIGVYPPGTIVKLNNGDPALVLDTDPYNPLNPTVVTIESLMKDGENADTIRIGEGDVSIQTPGTSRKAPEAIRNKILQERQIFSRLSKSA